jgi:Intracellular proteinase inhibitor
MRYTFPFLLVAILLVGCRAPKPIKSTSSAGNIGVELWASSDCVQPGETVKLRATATDEGAQAFSVELTDRPVFDLVVKTAGKTVHWSDGKPLTPELTRLELKPGASKTIQMDWKVQCCDNLQVTAPFIYSQKFADDPTSPYILVQVQYCAGPLGP